MSSKGMLIGLAAALSLTCGARDSSAAIITQLTSYGQMTAPLLINDFETTKDTSWVTFDSTAFLDLASSWAGGVTPSGVQGLVEGTVNEPLRATLTTAATEVGLTFGNDDFGLVFKALLSVFDSSNILLGTVNVQANRNDFADQFIGLRSDTPFSFVDIRYERPDAQGLSVYIDDFAIADTTAVPEPATLLLLATGVTALVATRRRRRVETRVPQS